MGFSIFRWGLLPDATGVENIYLRGLQMGLSLRNIKEVIPEVLEFAGVGSAINDFVWDLFHRYETKISYSYSLQ